MQYTLQLEAEAESVRRPRKQRTKKKQQKLNTTTPVNRRARTVQRLRAYTAIVRQAVSMIYDHRKRLRARVCSTAAHHL